MSELCGVFPLSVAAAQGSSAQSLAFAAMSEVTAHDIQDLSSLGNFGRDQDHVAGQFHIEILQE